MTPDQKTLIITIDGPAGAGKSTVAKHLAGRLKFYYLDTGAMYRALTLKAIRLGTDLENEQVLEDLSKATKIDLINNNSETKVLLDGEDVSEEIRSNDVTNKTFYVAQKPKVRQIMVGWQRAIGKNKNVVVEGRDLGTVVFPGAQHKFYLDAKINERSKRRIKELRDKGHNVDADRLTEELKDRDHKDLTRDFGPLKKAEDAIFIDSTDLTIDEVIDKMMKHININREA